MKAPSRYRLNLNDKIVQAFLGEYRLINNIPAAHILTDKERGDFEVWAITEGKRRNIDITLTFLGSTNI